MKQTLFMIPLGAGLAGLSYVIFTLLYLKRKHVNDQGFLHYARHVRFLTFRFVWKEYRKGLPVVILTAGGLFFLKTGISRLTVIPMILGSVVSAAVALIGTAGATRANRYTVQAARNSTTEALRLALRGGSVLGFSLTSISLGVITIIFLLLQLFFGNTPESLAAIVLPTLFGYALGAGISALIGRTSGGIFAKAADMSADLAGKLDRSLDEDDPRNPAVLADTVGDNVNDIAGLSLDLSESYAAALLASMLVGALSGRAELAFLPLLLAGSGLLASFVLLLFHYIPEQMNPGRKVMAIAIGAHLGILVIGFFSSLLLLKIDEACRIIGSYAGGILSGISLSLLAAYYTAETRRPVISTASAARYGTTPVILQGFSLGMGSTVLPILVFIGGLYISYSFAGFYGVTLAALGLMTGAPVHSGIDAAGTIIDNAGAFTMLGMFTPASRERTDKLDAMGNSFNAVGKGYTVCSAGFITIALFVVYKKLAGLEIIDLTEIHVLLGIIIGAGFSFFLSAYLFRALQRVFMKLRDDIEEIYRKGLQQNMHELREQLILTAQKRTLKYIFPTCCIVLVFPVVFWFIGDEMMLGGIIIGNLVTGTFLALFLNHTGGVWDNAKKYVEAGGYGGKNSEAHRAVIIGDTIGDPMKDLAGPAMDIVMKLIPIIAIILVGV